MRELLPVAVLAGLAGCGSATDPRTIPIPTPPTATSTAAQPATPAAPAKQLTARVGDVEVEVLGATLGRVPLLHVNAPPTQSDEPQLLIDLRVTNASKTRKLDFSGWSGRRQGAASLADELGNQYREFSYTDASGIMRRYSNADRSIHPGDSAPDWLTFERPVEAAKWLMIELPGAAIGAPESARLVFPVGEVVRADNPDPASLKADGGWPDIRGASFRSSADGLTLTFGRAAIDHGSVLMHVNVKNDRRTGGLVLPIAPKSPSGFHPIRGTRLLDQAGKAYPAVFCFGEGEEKISPPLRAGEAADLVLDFVRPPASASMLYVEFAPRAFGTPGPVRAALAPALVEGFAGR